MARWNNTTSAPPPGDYWGSWWEWIGVSMRGHRYRITNTQIGGHATSAIERYCNDNETGEINDERANETSHIVFCGRYRQTSLEMETKPQSSLFGEIEWNKNYFINECACAVFWIKSWKFISIRVTCYENRQEVHCTAQSYFVCVWKHYFHKNVM